MLAATRGEVLSNAEKKKGKKGEPILPAALKGKG